MRKCLMCDENVESGRNIVDVLTSRDPLCGNCRNAWVQNTKTFEIEKMKAFASYQYNEAFSDALIQFKEAGDEALKDIFLYPNKRMLQRKFKGYTLLLMPSTEEKRKRRGFNHLALLYECLGLPMLDCFEKMENKTQKEISLAERKEMAHGIRVKKGMTIPQKIVLVDDVITSGSTIRGALNALALKGKKVFIYAVSSTPKDRV